MRIVSVSGTKNTGKTTMVVNLIGELVKRGYNVGTIKHSHVSFDFEQKDTWKHREAGAIVVVGTGENETFFLVDKPMELDDIIEKMENLINLDFLIIEGYKTNNYAKIATSPLDDPFVLEEIDVRELKDDKISRIADLVVERSYGRITGLDCGECGFNGCQEMAEAIIQGKVQEDVCVVKKESDMNLIIDGKQVPLNPFVRKIMKNTFLGMLKSLKFEGDIDSPQKIELLIQDENNR